MKQKISVNLKYLIINIIMNILKILWVFPIDKMKIVYLSFNGKQYSDSPKYICEDICKRKSDLKTVWVFDDVKKFKYLTDKDYIIVKKKSLAFLYHFVTAKVVVINNSLNSYIPVRNKQTVLNTWHGGSPLKTVGLTESNISEHAYKYFKNQNSKITSFISSSVFFTDSVLHDSFAYYGEVLNYGLPRNSILMSPHDHIVEKVYNHFKIPNDENHKIVLYAPTFRGNANDADFLDESLFLDISLCLDELKKRFCGNFIFMFRAHHSFSINLSTETCLMASDYPDMQELLCAANILITDYSSCMGDFALTGKTVFLYTPDLDKYIADRGFYWDIYDLPFPVALSNNQMVDNIKCFDKNIYAERIKEYFDKLGTYESPESLSKASEWVLRKFEQ